MSSIFGFTYRAVDHSTLENAIGGLEYWNRIYGNTAKISQITNNSYIGCCIEHFSDQFHSGGPILTFQEMPAVVDALLYNRDELLTVLGMDPDSEMSDEDLLLRLINTKGFCALRQVNGDFAGAIFDQSKQEWILFRDHMGVRSLYYYMDNDKIVFSTDLRGIVSAPGVDKTVNGQFLYKFFVGINYLSQDQTDFQNIHCVLPGTITRIRLDRHRCRFRQKVYWQPRERKIRLGSDDEYIQRMRELITDAVHRRCNAVPGILGGELSGGLDSCTIDILMNRYGREAVYYSWCVSPEDHPLVEGDDERKVILDVCEQENITCRFRTAQDYISFQDELSEHMPPFINTLSSASGSRWMKSQGAKAVFSGHGGDEGVSHRATPFELLVNLELWSYFKIHWMYLKGKKLRLLRAIRSGYLEAKEKFPYNFHRLTKEEMYRPVFTKEFNEQIASECRIRPSPFRYAPYKYVRMGGSRFRLETCVFLGAYSGVRYLFPFIDYRVMDFAVSIPRRMHVNHETNRLIFRKAFQDIMPKSLQDVQYKDAPSQRNTDMFTPRNDAFHSNVDYLLRTLDVKIWEGIIDFDGLRFLHQTTISSEDTIKNYSTPLIKLGRCVLIQNTIKNAPRWRELDAENI